MPMEYLLLGLVVVMLIFMVINTRKRTKQMRAEQEKKARETVPGAKVLLQGGLYGTVVSYDADDLSASAFIELAPGAVVEVHSQAILRVIDPEEDVAEDVTDEEQVPGDDRIEDIQVETPEETRARLERDARDN